MSCHRPLAGAHPQVGVADREISVATLQGMAPAARRTRLAGEIVVLPSHEDVCRLGRPTRFVLPGTVNWETLDELGSRLCATLEQGPPTHLVAISASGILLATCALATCPQVVSFTVVKAAYQYDLKYLVTKPGDSVVLIDNSVHTGRTVMAAIASLQQDHWVSAVVKLIDYEDDLEERVNRSILEKTGVVVRSLYRRQEVEPVEE